MADFDHKPKTATAPASAAGRANDSINGLSLRILYVAGFSIFTGLFGMGITWLVAVTCLVILRHNQNLFSNGLLTGMLPVLLTGGALGFVIGLVLSWRVAGASPKIRHAVEQRYSTENNRVQIYFGAPLFIIIVSMSLLESWTHLLDSQLGAYAFIGLLMLIVTVSFLLYNHISPRFILPVGIIGWLLTLILALGFLVYTLRSPF